MNNSIWKRFKIVELFVHAHIPNKKFLSEKLNKEKIANVLSINFDEFWMCCSTNQNKKNVFF